MSNLKKIAGLIALGLLLPTLLALAPMTGGEPCDPAVACFDARLKPDGLLGDFYIDGVLVASGVNSARLTGTPNAPHSIEARNIQEPGGVGFGDVYNYPDASVVQQTKPGWIWRVTFFSQPRALKGALKYICAPNNAVTTDSLACRPTIDGGPQPDVAPGASATYFLATGAHAVHTDLVGDSAPNWSVTARDDTVVVAPPGITYLTAAFPRKGQFQISVSPATLLADIYVDGALVAAQVNSANVFISSDSLHAVEARNVSDPAASGRYAYQDTARTAIVYGGRTSPVTLRPIKVWLTGTVNVTCVLNGKAISDDAACEVNADGAPLGTIPASGRAAFTLANGAHSLSIATMGASASRWDSPLNTTVNIFGGSSTYYTARFTLRPVATTPAAQPGQPVVVPVGPVSGTPGGFELGGQVNEFSRPDQMKYAGMVWVKRQIYWTPGATPDGGAIADAHAKGFKILIALVGNAGDLVGGANYDSLAAFAGQVAALGADAIEVWNEPNLDRSWPQGEIDPVKYVDLLRRSYQQIKAHHPGTLVISAAPSPTGAEGAFGLDRVWNDDRYLRGMVAAGAANYLDCVGVHYNEGIISPLQTSGDPRDGYYTRYYGNMVSVYYNAFGGAKKLCFTELGYLTPEGYSPLPGFFGWAGNTTVAQQAQWLGEVVTLARTSISVRMVIVFNVDFTDYGDDPQAGFAIIRPGGSCPACDRLHTVTGGR